MGEAYMRVKSKADDLDKQASTFGQQAEARRNGPQQAAGAGQAKPAVAPARQAAAPPETPATQPYKPTAAAGAAKGSKTATLATVRSYAQQKGISEAAAVKEFKGYGYQIGK
jgi:pyruvate/2-oxoglutarate dehydrogenase complex dihydrolipoamide acyltransferase (E2) component